MKQQQDDPIPNPQFKQQESDVQSQAPSSAHFEYLKELKVALQDEIHKYNTFLTIMGDFRAKRIDALDVIKRVKDLLEGHPNLILKFNTFLPKVYEITLDEEEGKPKETHEFSEEISFVKQIERRFKDDMDVYESFLDIMTGSHDINYVVREVSNLFENHADLLDEFMSFIPQDKIERSDIKDDTKLNEEKKDADKSTLKELQLEVKDLREAQGRIETRLTLMEQRIQMMNHHDKNVPPPPPPPEQGP